MDHALPGWVRLDDGTGGVPVWRRADEPVYVATRDTDQLLFLGAALTSFAQMSPAEFVAFVTGPPFISTRHPPAPPRT